METKVFKTLIKGNHDLGRNNYVIGRISGIKLCTIGEFGDEIKESANKVNKETGDIIMTAIGTAEDYDNFRYLIEKEYPGLCIFDYKD